MVGGIFCSVRLADLENNTNKYVQKVDFLCESYRMKIYFLEEEGIVF
jgi:hypothetical protein